MLCLQHGTAVFCPKVNPLGTYKNKTTTKTGDYSNRKLRVWGIFRIMGIRVAMEIINRMARARHLSSPYCSALTPKLPLFWPPSRGETKETGLFWGASRASFGLNMPVLEWGCGQSPGQTAVTLYTYYSNYRYRSLWARQGLSWPLLYWL